MSTDGRDDFLNPLATSAIAWCGFDAAWYRLAAGLEATVETELLDHYLATGRHSGLGPNLFFDEAWYRTRNPDAAAAIAAGACASGYEHYCATGYLTRSAHWLYDDDIYALHAPDLTDHVLVAYNCANRYDHYLKAGAGENRLAHLLFQPALYTATLGDVAAEVHNPYGHFLRHLWLTRTDAPTSLYFDPTWYLAHTPAAGAMVTARRGLGALHHFLTAPDAGDPLAAFSAQHYGATTPDAVDAVRLGRCTSLYDHFLKTGVHRFASPAPGIDLARHLSSHPDARRAIEAGEVRDLFAHYLLHTPAHDLPLTDVAPPSAPPLAPAAQVPTPTRPSGTAATPESRPVVVGVLEFGVTSATICPPDAVLITGWVLAPTGLVTDLYFVCGDQNIRIEPSRRIATARADILAAHPAHSADDLMCGFIAFVSATCPPGERMFVAAHLADGTTAIRPAPLQTTHGLPAIRALLDGFDLRYGALAEAMANVIAPAVARLGADFNAWPLPREAIQFGPPPAAPRLTLIIPLHGRLDFMEYQLALFSRGAEAHAHDIIYVLDDPPRRREAEVLAASCLARFGIAFRLVVLGRNAGYAVANNVGLAFARAGVVGLLNSDVFPNAPGDFDDLAARLEADPGLGAVGPLLLFEDGAIQHQGMEFERLAAFCDMHFPFHPGKGLLPTADTGLRVAPAITGACMILRRAELETLGGLDPAFLVGDFEDSDLCLRLAASGKRVAVDHGVRMHHLERQSQAGSEQRWRMNLTLYNAWTHEQRWGTTLSASTPA